METTHDTLSSGMSSNALSEFLSCRTNLKCHSDSLRFREVMDTCREMSDNPFMKAYIESAFQAHTISLEECERVARVKQENAIALAKVRMEYHTHIVQLILAEHAERCAIAPPIPSDNEKTWQKLYDLCRETRNVFDELGVEIGAAGKLMPESLDLPGLPNNTTGPVFFNLRFHI